jgi:hypothetical protein
MSQSYDEGTERVPRDDDRDVDAGLPRPGRHDEPDVLLDVTELRVDEISLEVEDLTARVSLQANVLDLLKLHVGVDAALGGVQLTIKGVEAKVLLKARLDNVARIIDRVLTTIDTNPEIIGQLTEPVGHAVAEVAAGTADVVDDVVTGAGSAIATVGEPARAAVGEVGKGAAEIVKDRGQGIANADADLAEDTVPQAPAQEPGSAGRSRARAAPPSAGGPGKGPRPRPQPPAQEPGSGERSRARAAPPSAGGPGKGPRPRPQPPAQEPGSGERSRPRAAPSPAGGPGKGPSRPRDRGPEER